MFRVFIDTKTDEYCIRSLSGKKAGGIWRYKDYRLFASDLKVMLENEGEINLAVSSVTKTDKGSSGGDGLIIERRTGDRRGNQHGN